jgi:guanosine phosphorylase
MGNEIPRVFPAPEAPLMIIGIIGGSGITAALLDSAAEPRLLETAHGSTAVTVGEVDGEPVAFLARHGEGHALLPHQVNYRANALALHALGITRVIATSACGSLRADLPPGSLALLTDFIDFTRARPWTLATSEGEVNKDVQDKQDDGTEFPPSPSSCLSCTSLLTSSFHLDMAEPYCASLRGALASAAAELSLPLHPGATYVCVEGPRYETHAEIRMFRVLGADLVGMTGVPEVTLARELGQCYASIGIVTNAAAGLAEERLRHAEVEARVAAIRQQVTRLLRAAVRHISLLPGCPGHGPREQ